MSSPDIEATENKMENVERVELTDPLQTKKRRLESLPHHKAQEEGDGDVPDQEVDEENCREASADESPATFESVQAKIIQSVETHSLVNLFNKFGEDMEELQKRKMKTKTALVKLKELEKQLRENRDQYRYKLTTFLQSMNSSQPVHEGKSKQDVEELKDTEESSTQDINCDENHSKEELGNE